MQRSVRPPRALKGALSPPGDKSISHRAAIFNAIADGPATVHNFQRGADVQATLRCLQQLGVRHEWLDETTLRIFGVGCHGLSEPAAILDARNSGTTIRLLAGLLAPQPFLSVLTGDASLRSRPMERIIQPLRLMGADIHARHGDSKAPLTISGGPLRGIRYRLPVASAQVKSALILAALYADGETTLETPTPSRDHTERMLQAMGSDIRCEEGAVAVRPLTRDPQPLTLSIPGDISAAACWLVAAVLHPNAELRLAAVGVNPSRSGILDCLWRMGADLRLENERSQGPEPIADIVVRSSPGLRGTVIEGGLIPRLIDEIPLLALAASLAKGETIVRDAAELRHKETDRIRTTSHQLRRLGADIEELPDGMRIRGVDRLRGAVVSSHGDHRLAMLLAVAGTLAQGETIVRNSQAVEVSYPWFWRDLERVSAAP